LSGGGDAGGDGAVILTFGCPGGGPGATNGAGREEEGIYCGVIEEDGAILP